MAELRTIITLRQGTTEQWSRSTVILALGEIGLEYLADGSTRFKAGNGSSLWADLPYVASGEIDTLKVLLADEIARATAIEDAIQKQVEAQGSILALKANQTDVDDLAALVDGNAAAIKVINEESIPALSEEIKSVDETLKLALDNNTEGLDSIKELALWITEHGSDAAEMVRQIEVLQELIGDTSVADQIAAAGHLSEEDAALIYLSKAQAEEVYEGKKFAIEGTPAGTLIDYRDDEIRVMVPANATYSKQNVGAGGNPNIYYMAFKTYAPSDDAIGYIEHIGAESDPEILTNISVDMFGRKYQTTWLAVSMYNEATDSWTYYGANSTTKKYIGWDYRIDWYNASGVKIASDSIRINLSNENCHNMLEPYFMGKSIDGITLGGTVLDIVDRKVEIPVGAGLKESDEIKIAANGTLSVGVINVNKLVQTEELVLNGGKAI